MTREVVQIIDKETGDVNNLRDKKLADSTTQQQSGSASTDSVVMKTTGGDYVEIARDSFVGAIKNVMDGLIKGNSYTTLGANDPIAAFNGNALGGITPANLASVLGGVLQYGGTGVPSSLSDHSLPTIYFLNRLATSDILPVGTGHRNSALIIIPRKGNGWAPFLALYFGDSGSASEPAAFFYYHLGKEWIKAL